MPHAVFVRRNSCFDLDTTLMRCVLVTSKICHRGRFYNPQFALNMKAAMTDEQAVKCNRQLLPQIFLRVRPSSIRDPGAG